MPKAYIPVFSCWNLSFAALIACLLISCAGSSKQEGDSKEIFSFDENLSPRWSSPENRNGQPGKAGMENNGAKGHAFDSIPSGGTVSLIQVDGPGIINRIWITVADRSPAMLRSLRIDMYWDGEKKPAVSAPLGDFFGVGLGKTARFENIFFANAEGRSFNCFIPMPFRKSASITVTNEASHALSHIFFDVDYNLLGKWKDDYMYLHAFWHRDTATELAHDFELLPAVQGRGRFLGVNVGIQANPLYQKSWWGEGEVKMYIDADREFPTIAGTGTEDYIGTGWGQGIFANRHSGCLVADDSLLQWSYYRYHVPDPVYFRTACKVTIQQMGGEMKSEVSRMQHEKIPLIPVTIDAGKGLIALYKKGSVTNLDNPALPEGWTNYFRSDDVSATAYFYLDAPTSELPALQPVTLRTYKLK